MTSLDQKLREIEGFAMRANVRRLKAFDCNDLMLAHSGPGALLFVLASDYDVLATQLGRAKAALHKINDDIARADLYQSGDGTKNCVLSAE
jgi:hypothetical protein